MGRHQAYKTDQPAYGNSRRRYQGSNHDDEQLVTFDMQPQVCRALFAQSKGIEDTREHQGEDYADKYNSSNHYYGRPACDSHTTSEPVEESHYAELCMRTKRQNERLERH